jgi:hypothetical protein
MVVDQQYLHAETISLDFEALMGARPDARQAAPIATAPVGRSGPNDRAATTNAVIVSRAANVR